MCRLVAYLGHEVLIEHVVVKPFNSIVMQSLHARESKIPTNGDGFGLGWYMPSISPDPGLFTSISPAWNDNNLLHLAAKIKSPCFFAHVRAASAGGVTQYNCHPFIFGPWMLMHNGEICHFIEVKRHLRHLLEDDIYHWIQGETDSEHLFALFLQQSRGHDLTKLSVVADVLESTFHKINELVHQFSKPGASSFNVCLTDGKRLVASRFCTHKHKSPETMHYSLGSRFGVTKDRYHLLKEDSKRGSLLVASEKLTRYEAEWQDVPINHMLLVESDLHIELRPIRF